MPAIVLEWFSAEALANGCQPVEQLTDSLACKLGSAFWPDDRIHPLEQVARQVQVRRDVVKRWAAHRDIIASNS